MSEEFPHVPLLFIDPLDEDSKSDIRKNFQENKCAGRTVLQGQHGYSQ
jgi:hypothetical protein